MQCAKAGDRRFTKKLKKDAGEGDDGDATGQHQDDDAGNGYEQPDSPEETFAPLAV